MKIVVWLALAMAVLGSSLVSGAEIRPDLIPVSLTLTQGNLQGVKVLRTVSETTFDYAMTIKNVGAGNAADFCVAVLKSENRTFLADRETVDKKSFTSLLAGQSLTITGTISIVGASDAYYLGLLVDSDNQADESREDNNFSKAPVAIATVLVGNYRSADPCQKLIGWQAEIISPELWNGQAEHDFSPAQYIVFAAKENTFNLVSELVLLELSQQLITVGTVWNKDLEYRLLEAMNYGNLMETRSRWYGFVPQCVGTTYQYSLEKQRGLTFREAFENQTAKQERWSEFRTLYSQYAWLMNYYLGADYPLLPELNSDEYYLDFPVTPRNQRKAIAAVQQFLEALNSPLMDKDLFRKKTTPSLIRYDAVDKFCQ